MKKLRVKGILPLFAAVVLALIVWAGISPPVSVSADAAGAYDYEIERYEVDMTVSPDRMISVEERITASFTGYNSHGIIRDFPLDGGVRYRNISAKCDSDDFSPYFQTDDSAFLSYYLRGSGSVRGSERTYTITYEMHVPALAEEGYLPLDVIGYGWQTQINDVTATITVPDGLNNYKVYSGRKSTAENDCGVEYSREGNVITLRADELGSFYNDYNYDYYDYYAVSGGITLDMSFEAGVLSVRADYESLWALLIGAAVLVVVIALKMLVFRNPVMTTTVNLEAPDEMDPMRMGKYIDNSVDSEDIGALIFWLADKGYLHIDMSENDDDPTLFKTEKPLPDDAEEHVKLMYNRLFRDGESIRVSSLTDSFYTTANKMKTSVNAEAGGFYTAKSKFFAGFLCVLSALVLGGFAFFYALGNVAANYYFWAMLPVCLIGAVAGALGTYLMRQREHKWKMRDKILVPAVCSALGLLITAFASFLFSGAAMSFLSCFLLAVFAVAAGNVAGLCLCRTEKYSRLLGHIVGFKQFIVFTERDKIEFMLKDNPQLYYKILPYAQVLGVTDAWTDKFEGLDINPPVYATTSSDFVFDCVIWGSLFRSMNRSFSRAMISRPSSSGGHGGGFSGGFGGGFGGGGFGGGGGRGC